MPMYVVAVADLYTKTNINMVTWAENEVCAMVASACKKNNKPVSEKILNKYQSIEEVKNYFADYWNISIATPVKYTNMV